MKAAILTVAASMLACTSLPAAVQSERTWTLILENVFRGGTKPVYLYARERDGGVFAEGDGTGSMASQIAYLSAVQAWRNAAGKDFIGVERPNVRMMTLKWPYQTVMREGRPEVWPLRGEYKHNVWAREGLSGAGYFAIGLGSVREQERAAMKWWYNRFLREVDAEAGTPYDTASKYPHLAVSAFVNWPTELEAVPMAEVLPLCYRDSVTGFYVWRNRWQDENDTVITVLTNRTEGYMGSKPDRELKIHSGGERYRWGSVPEGPTRYWWASPMGHASSLTLSDGTSFAVDFTGASGEDIMLVTTGEAEGPSVKLGGETLTFHFPASETAPDISTRGGQAVVGDQRISIEDGNLALEVTQKKD